MEGKSMNIAEDNLKKLKEVFPMVFKEGRVDFLQLRALLGEEITVGEEAYGLSWTGKYECFKEIQKQSFATLVPDREISIDFEGANNIFIEGENLEALRVLQKSYYGKIKMIYIDPPYNTGNDSFVYPDDYTERKEEYRKRAGIINDKGYINKQDLWQKNTKENGQYHSVWLSMIYPRLFLSRNLLREDGVIFVSIDDNEYANLKLIMDEIFGAENFRNVFAVRRYDKNLNRQFIDNGLMSFNVGFEYILCYSKSNKFSFNPVYKEASEERQSFGYWKGFWNSADRPTMRYDILGYTPETGQWKWSEEKGQKAVENYQTYLKEYADKMTLEEYWVSTGKSKNFIRRVDGKGQNKGVDHWIPPTEGILRNTNWTDIFASKVEPEIKDVFDFPKNVDLIKNLISMSDDNDDDIILDFFAGSGSTAHAVIDYNLKHGSNKKFICIQIPEEITDEKSSAYQKGFRTISQVTRHRIKSVIEKNQSKNQLNFAKNCIGCKCFILQNSNFKKWQNILEENNDILKSLELFKTPEYNENFEWILYELLLKMGYPLTTDIEQINVNDCNFYAIDGKRVLLFLETITPNAIEEIFKISPKLVACLDSIFDEKDQLMTNLKLRLDEHKITFKTDIP